VRSCGSIVQLIPGQNGCETTYVGDDFNEVCECKTEGCNGAMSVFMNITLIFSLIFAVLFLNL
jgi:hypothetical protein